MTTKKAAERALQTRQSRAGDFTAHIKGDMSNRKRVGVAAGEARVAALRWALWSGAGRGVVA